LVDRKLLEIGLRLLGVVCFVKTIHAVFATWAILNPWSSVGDGSELTVPFVLRFLMHALLLIAGYLLYTGPDRIAGFLGTPGSSVVDDPVAASWETLILNITGAGILIVFALPFSLQVMYYISFDLVPVCLCATSYVWLGLVLMAHPGRPRMLVRGLREIGLVRKRRVSRAPRGTTE
jgi:hypothetical protein